MRKKTIKKIRVKNMHKVTDEVCRNCHLDVENDCRMESLCSALEETFARFQCVNESDSDLVFSTYGVYAPSCMYEDYCNMSEVDKNSAELLC